MLTIKISVTTPNPRPPRCPRCRMTPRAAGNPLDNSCLCTAGQIAQAYANAQIACACGVAAGPFLAGEMCTDCGQAMRAVEAQA